MAQTTEERLAQLEAMVGRHDTQQHLQTEALRRLTEGKYTGAEGAAGIVVALEGGKTQVQAKDPFSKA